MGKEQIQLVGVDAYGLVPEKEKIVASSSHIFCADRFFDLLQPITARSTGVQIFNISPLSSVLEKIEELRTDSSITVLVGGDPLFFGIARALCRRFGHDSIRIYPAVSSMQAAFSRFRIPWDDALFLSVHGRDLDGLVAKIGNHQKVFLLTDGKNSPDRIAEMLLTELGKKQVAGCRVYVAEKLDFPDERLTTGTLKEIALGKFCNLSVMILLFPKKEGGCRFGLQEKDIIHSRGLITKNEVRAATLHALQIPERGVFWDIGAGSGSISIEAGRMSPDLDIYSVEAKTDQIVNIQANKTMFSISSLTPVQGIAPDVLQKLPDPNRIFIGGSGGNLEDILTCCAGRLHSNGVLVVNGVLEKTCRNAPKILHQLGFEVSISMVTVSRSTFPPEHPLVFNPIAIITGCREKVVIER